MLTTPLNQGEKSEKDGEGKILFVSLWVASSKSTPPLFFSCRIPNHQNHPLIL